MSEALNCLLNTPIPSLTLYNHLTLLPSPEIFTLLLCFKVSIKLTMSTSSSVRDEYGSESDDRDEAETLHASTDTVTPRSAALASSTSASHAPSLTHASPNRSFPLPSPSQTSSPSSAGKRNFVWPPEDVVRLVSFIYNNESFQRAILPSRITGAEEPVNKLRKGAIYRELFTLVFPSATPIDPDRIKSKVRWLQGIYNKEKAKLSLTGAGFLEGLDPSDPVSTQSIFLGYNPY